jgi:hypothetical protein
MQGDEIRALRRLQREQEASPHVFASERGGPMSANRPIFFCSEPEADEGGD